MSHWIPNRKPRGGSDTRFRSKVDAFQKAVPVWWCLPCNKPAGQERQRGSKKEMACSHCGSRGHYFPSTGQQRRYAHLMMLQNAGEIEMLRLEVSLPAYINGIKVATYIADFVYRDVRSGKLVFEDYKGSKNHTDQASAVRRRCAEAQYLIKVNLVEA